MFEEVITHYPDFPKPGIDFIDVLPFLQDKKVFKQVIEQLDAATTTPNVATVEARGFLFAAPLLTASSKVETIIPIRKKGKLPFAKDDLHKVCIEKEYGSDEVFYRLTDIASGVPEGDTIYVSLLDDLLATGGTALGIAQALNKEVVVKGGKTYKVKVKEFLFLVELTDLNGAAILEELAPVHSILKIAGTDND